MAKQNFSSSVGDSLQGRSSTNTKNETPTTKPTVPASALDKKNSAGRPKVEEAVKRQQFMLTLAPLTYKTIDAYSTRNLKKTKPVMNAILDNVILNIIKPYTAGLSEEDLKKEDIIEQILKEHYDEIEKQIKLLLI